MEKPSTKILNHVSSLHDNGYYRAPSFCVPLFSLDFHTLLDCDTKQLFPNMNTVVNMFLLHMKGFKNARNMFFFCQSMVYIQGVQYVYSR